MKRYMPAQVGNGTVLVEHGVGLYVLHSDAWKEIIRRDKEIANLRTRLELADALLNKERSKAK